MQSNGVYTELGGKGLAQVPGSVGFRFPNHIGYEYLHIKRRLSVPIGTGNRLCLQPTRYNVEWSTALQVGVPQGQLV